MGRGFIAGILWGLVVSGGMLALGGPMIARVEIGGPVTEIVAPEAGISEPDENVGAPPQIEPAEPVVDSPSEPEPAPAPEPMPAPAPEPAPNGQSLLTPVPPLGHGANVITGRLPHIGAERDVAMAAPAPAEPALERFSRPFAAPAGRPLMSIVLTARDLAELAGLDMPLSIAVDAAQENAAQIAAEYRAAGQEVLAILALPQGATPADAAHMLEGVGQVMPEAIAVMDTPAASFQADWQIAAQVMAAAHQAGQGVLTWPRGLDSAQQIAAREGVAAAQIFRAIDADGGQEAVLRALDQAAFRAGQSGGVIVVAQATPAMIDALHSWRQGSRAAGVTLAPVSALLRAARPI